MTLKTLEPDPEFTLDARALPPTDEPSRPMPPARPSRFVAFLLVLLALIAGAAAWLLLRPPNVPPAVPVAPSAPSTPPVAQALPEPAIAHPVENIAADAAAAPAALPMLDASDALARDAIDAIVNGGGALRLLAPEGVVRKIVATVDNLPRKSVATRLRPVEPVSGAFMTSPASGATTIAADNAARYAAYVRAAESIDTQRLAGFYVRMYPLFQQAYVELGYPNGYFNDRVIAVIDNLLAAPEPAAPVQLVQPKVLFEYADPDLEALSAGQKILVRVGLDHERRLKAKLRELRRALTAAK